MKKILILFVIACCAIISNAQVWVWQDGFATEMDIDSITFVNPYKPILSDVVIKAVKPTEWDNDIFIWAWNVPDEYKETFIPMQKEGEWYTFTFNIDLSKYPDAGFLFVNGSAWEQGQTADLNLTESRCYQIQFVENNKDEAVEVDCDELPVSPKKCWELTIVTVNDVSLTTWQWFSEEEIIEYIEQVKAFNTSKSITYKEADPKDEESCAKLNEVLSENSQCWLMELTIMINGFPYKESTYIWSTKEVIEFTIDNAKAMYEAQGFDVTITITEADAADEDSCNELDK